MTTWQKLLLFITLSSGVMVPLTNDMFLAGIPAMQHVFLGQNIALVLGMSLLGLALAQPFYGPLLDHFGRKPVLIIGVLIYTLASLVVMQTNSFHILLVARIIQAIGVCSTITSGLAIARDLYEGPKLTQTLGYLSALMAIGPVTAPLLGSFLNIWFDWRASFQALFYLGIFYSLVIIICFKETHPAHYRKPLSFKYTMHTYKNLIKMNSFLNFCMASGFTYGAFFSFIALASIFMIKHLHLSLIAYGIAIAINGIVIMLTSIFVPKLCEQHTHATVSKIGLGFITLGGFFMFILNISSDNTIYTFMLPMLICTVGVGFVRTAASAGAMQLVNKSIAGTAASFYNLFSFVLSILAMSLSTAIIHSIAGLGLFIAILSSIALLLIALTSMLFLSKKQNVSIQYNITRQIFDDGLTFFELQHVNNDSKLIKSSIDIAKDKKLLNSLSQEDAYLIGYVSGCEQANSASYA